MKPTKLFHPPYLERKRRLIAFHFIENIRTEFGPNQRSVNIKR
jgi:hypothetical protein